MGAAYVLNLPVGANYTTRVNTLHSSTPAIKRIHLHTLLHSTCNILQTNISEENAPPVCK